MEFNMELFTKCPIGYSEIFDNNEGIAQYYFKYEKKIVKSQWFVL